VDRPQALLWPALPEAETKIQPGGDIARPDPANCPGDAQLWSSRVTKQLQRQGYQVGHKRMLRLMRKDNPLILPQEAVSGACHHKIPTQVSLLSQLGTRTTSDRHQSTLGSRYHLHPSATAVSLSGSGPGCLQSESDRLGIGGAHSCSAHVRGPADGGLHLLC